MAENQDRTYDYVIIGSGFGGSVSALRLAEKGYKVLVVEKGKWFRSDDFPKTNWNLKRWLWVPFFRFFGIMKLSFFRHATILSGVGVGGGSLVYANTLPVPKKEFFSSGSWSHLADWKKELEPFYSIASKMLGATKNPRLQKGDLALKELAGLLGKDHEYDHAHVGVYFGKPGEKAADPYFEGIGPDRIGCIYCGGCMTGCRHDAKNSLDKNYLFLAQKKGADIIAESEVYDVRTISNDDGTGGYQIKYRSSTRIIKKKATIKTAGVIFSGGVMGTVKLLLSLKKKSLPFLSDRIGHDIRTNNESLVAITSLNQNIDYSEGVAIGSILHTDESSHLEPVRYGKGSGFWRLSVLPMTQGNNTVLRMYHIVCDWIKKPLTNLKMLFVKDWARQTQVMLFMQHLDSTLRFSSGMAGMKSSVTEGKSPRAFIPRAAELAGMYSKLLNGKPYVFFAEILFGIPSTAHILGGAVMASDKSKGVIDKDNRVFGYKNMLVCDGAAISANPGVNPSLTITAIAERAMSKIPGKEQDQSE
jgi:cholesterol oxidase